MFENFMFTTTDWYGDAVVVRLNNTTLDSTEVGKLARLWTDLEQIASTGGVRWLILDLTAVRSFGALLMGLLVRLHQAMQMQDKRLVVCDRPNHLLSLVRLDELLPVFLSADEALDECSKSVERRYVASLL